MKRSQEPSSYDQAIGANVRRFRKAKGLTLAALSERAGCSLPMVQKIEAGTRRLSREWHLKFAEILGVAPEELVADGVRGDEIAIRVPVYKPERVVHVLAGLDQGDPDGINATVTGAQTVIGVKLTLEGTEIVAILNADDRNISSGGTFAMVAKKKIGAFGKRKAAHAVELADFANDRCSPRTTISPGASDVSVPWDDEAQQALMIVGRVMDIHLRP